MQLQLKSIRKQIVLKLFKLGLIPSSPTCSCKLVCENDKKIDADFVILARGYHLNSKIEGQVNTTTDQEEALKNADFVYAKNWCSYKNYGKILKNDSSWKITSKKMNLTNNAKFMHCLPVRRNIIVSDSVIESPNSLVIQQARNRVYATQLILKKLIENE